VTTEVILIDAGTGNLRSVLKALESLEARVNLTSDPAALRRGGRVVLPGVGAFGDFMQGLRNCGLDEAVREVAARGDLLLGICVGMQALFDFSEEMGLHTGLGLIGGKVVRFPGRKELKVPHTGWNQLVFSRESPLFSGMKSGCHTYFNHSYYCLPEDIPGKAIATTDYGLSFTSAIQDENIFGVQFHPEKSQQVGLKILQNFLEVTHSVKM
jgi:glutamine amidotransferase